MVTTAMGVSCLSGGSVIHAIDGCDGVPGARDRRPTGTYTGPLGAGPGIGCRYAGGRPGAPLRSAGARIRPHQEAVTESLLGGRGWDESPPDHRLELDVVQVCPTWCRFAGPGAPCRAPQVRATCRRSPGKGVTPREPAASPGSTRGCWRAAAARRRSSPRATSGAGPSSPSALGWRVGPSRP